MTTLSFDIAGLELFLPLTVGATVVIASVEAAADPSTISFAAGASQDYGDAGDPRYVASLARIQLGRQSASENTVWRRGVVVAIGGAVAAALRLALEHVWAYGDNGLVIRAQD